MSTATEQTEKVNPISQAIAAESGDNTPVAETSSSVTAPASVSDPAESKPVSDDTAPDTEANSQESTPEPTEPETPSFIDQARELGFENIESEADAQARILQAYREVSERQQQLQAENQQYQTIQQQLEELRNQVAPKQEPAPVDSDDPWQRVTQFDLERAKLFADGTDEKGNVNWKPGTPADVIQGYENYQSEQDRFYRTLAQRPEEIFEKPIQHIVDKLLNERLQQVQQQTAQQTAQQQIIEQNKDWLYAKDPITGQIDTNRLSKRGELVDAEMTKLMERGVDDIAYAFDLANRIVPQAPQQTQQVAPSNGNTTPTLDPAAQKKREFVEQTNRGGSFQQEGNTQNRTLSNRDTIREALLKEQNA